jgi:hypothetical protein
MQRMLQVGGDLLDCPLFTSNVTLELAEGLARNVKSDLKRFLLYV